MTTKKNKILGVGEKHIAKRVIYLSEAYNAMELSGWDVSEPLRYIPSLDAWECIGTKTLDSKDAWGNCVHGCSIKFECEKCGREIE